MPISPSPKLRPLRRCLALAAVALAVGAGLSACTSGPTPGSSASAGASGTTGGSGAGTAGDGAATAGDGAGTAAIVPTASTLRWSQCGGSLSGSECATLAVPLNYADPGGRKITLALSMIPATAPAARQQGVLLVNPGGPGEPGRSLAAAVAAGLSPQVAATYDIVGFDPRGVGGSVPALSCDPSFFDEVRPDYIPASAAAEQVLIGRAKAYAAGCEQRFGWLLPYMTTVNTARDMDQIRQAFGVAKVNYYGFSYGTYLGQVYGTLFPDRVRRMVLDSTVDPTGAWYTDNIDQDYAFQGRLDAFFAWTARYDSAYHLGSTQAQVRAAYYKVRGELEKTPIAGPNGPLIGPDELDDTFVITGYLNSVWPAFAQALSQYAGSGNGSGLINQYQMWGTTQREHVRGLQRGRVRRRELAQELVEVAGRHRARLQDRAVRGLGQRLVQRGLRLLAGQGPGRALQGGRLRAAAGPDAAGHAGPGDAVRGRAGRAPAAAERPHGGGGGRRQPRAVAREPAEPVRAGLPERLPRHRRGAGAAGSGQRDLPGHR